MDLVKKIGMTLFMALLAVLGNYFHLPLFFGLDFIFGSVAVMAALVLLGWLPGCLVALAGGAYTVLLWGHPYALIIFAAEALVVGALLRRIGHLALADMLFWLVCGVPLVVLFYGGSLGLDWSTTSTVMLKQVINGLLNALLASFLVQFIRATRSGRKGEWRANLSIRRLMFDAFLAVGLIAGLVSMAVNSYNTRNDLHLETGKELNAMAQRLARQLEREGGVPQSALDAMAFDDDVIWALYSAQGQLMAGRGILHASKPGSRVDLSEILDGLGVWLPGGKMALVARWRLGYYTLDLPEVGRDRMRLHLETAAAPAVIRTEFSRLRLLALMAAIAAFSVLVAWLLSRWLTQPIVQIEALSRALPERVTQGRLEPIQGSRIVEFDGLRRSLQTMADRLAGSFGELRHMRDSLERQVQERTALVMQREQALEEFKSTLDRTLDGIIMFDARAERFLYVNQGALDMVGYSREELMQLHPHDLIPKTSAISFRAKLAPLLYGERGSLTFETEFRHKNGEVCPVEVFAQYLPSEGRQPRFVAIVRDIRERKQTELKLLKSEERLQLALQAARSSLWDANPVSGRIVLDARWAELVGEAPRETEVNFQELAQRVPPEEQAEVLQKMMATIKGLVNEYHAEHRVRHQQGHWIWIESRGRVVERDAAGRALRMMGTNTDISDRKRLDQMKNEFVSTVSHELRTPLTSISGVLGLAMGGALGELPAQARQMLDMAHKNSLRLASLINDLLDMEKLAAGKMQFVLRTQPLMPLVEHTMASTRAYGEQHQVSFVLTERADAALAHVDGGRLEQVLANFLSNAAKFSPPGAQVEVSVHELPERVRVAVTDHGPGIPMAFRDRIFKKFSQADASDTRSKGGTGLGLAISKELIERMQGTVGFESEEGHGACFYFELPLMSKSA